MAASVHGLLGAQLVKSWNINVFGVRHLSPSGAWHLRRYLDRIRPKVVLIEGLADAEDMIPHIVKKTTRMIAILAYTDAPPVHARYPLATYSPEFQAMLWAKENNARVEHIDLPSDVFLGLQDLEIERYNRLAKKAEEEAAKEDAGDEAEAKPQGDAPPQALGIPERAQSIYGQIAERAGEPDYDTYWERRFEHNLAEESYRRASFEFGQALRDREDPPIWRAENLVRWAFMRRRIEEVLESVKPEQVVAVVGAFHAPVLTGEHPAMTDEELASLRRRPSKLTLMPYSYFKLSTQSGYGAGNHAPSYFELLWDMLQSDGLHELPMHYLSMVARHLRDVGTHRSTAEVIEGVRLPVRCQPFMTACADARPARRGGDAHRPRRTVDDQRSPLAVDVGTAIGELPRGVSRTSIQADFDREMDRLKLEKFRTTVKQELVLDLREDRRAKTAESAFLDLNRSSFFHRLRVLDIGFAKPDASGQQSTTWAEKWHVQWSPENEIALVEAVLLGETIELAASFKFKTNLDNCQNIGAASDMVVDACQCGLGKSMDMARKRLQELAAVGSNSRPSPMPHFSSARSSRSATSASSTRRRLPHGGVVRPGRAGAAYGRELRQCDGSNADRLHRGTQSRQS